ncbi:uncharacterized protein [Lepeophtheirus salmonis]|uniref:uncharacterized protein n=1 Tax=Lepeophtheirus salmonis TaxID=72036 RepID=UPI001AE643C7|nr:uncharacterized protein LOC121120571 [Lepeophtheirus salmonis]
MNKPGIIIILLTTFIGWLKGQDCVGILTFDKLTNTILDGVPKTLLFENEKEPITAKCNNICRSSANCSGFNLDYDTNSCYSFESKGNKESLTSVNDRFSYFEKTCLQGIGCEKAWLFERFPGFELIGLEDVTLDATLTLKDCQKECLEATDLPCRSAMFNYERKTCQLSRETRRSQPSAYRASVMDVEYLENQCAPKFNVESGCNYQESKDMDLKYADLTFKSNSRENCQERCDNMTVFNCRSFTFQPTTLECSLSGDDTFSAREGNLVNQVGKNYYQKAPCLDVRLNCTSDAMEVTLNKRRGFFGKIFALFDSKNCFVDGSGDRNTSLTIPYAGENCKLRKSNDEAFYTTIVIQEHPVIQKKGDQAITIYCFFKSGDKVVTDNYEVLSESFNTEFPDTFSDISSSILNSTAPVPSVELRIVDSLGQDVTGTKLGEPLFLRIELQGTSLLDIFARNLRARSGIDDEEILLIDDVGCPIDSVFSGLTKENGTGHLLGRFEAFKFSDTSIVNFQVNVQFCDEKCNPVDCINGGQSFGRRRKKRSEDYGSFHSFDGIRRSNRSNKRLVFDEILKQEVIIEEEPLKKQIFVDTGIAVASFKHPRIDVGTPGVFVQGDYSEKDVVCTTWTVVIGVSSSIIFLQFCILLVCVLCIYASRRSKYIDGAESLTDSRSIEGSTSFRNNSRKPLYFRSPIPENSEKALQVLRTSLRD